MLFEVLKSKIHMARVTESNKDYAGSITIDRNLAQQVGIMPNEKVLVGNVENGNRFETYVIYGGKGEICVNGAAANLAEQGDRLIIMSFAYSEDRTLTPKVIKVDGENKVI